MGCIEVKSTESKHAKRTEESQPQREEKVTVIKEKEVIVKEEVYEGGAVKETKVVRTNQVETAPQQEYEVKEKRVEEREVIVEQQQESSPENRQVVETITVYKLEEVEEGEAFSFPTSAWYTENGEEIEMKIKKIELGENGKIRLKGKDDIGHFKMRGRFLLDGKVYIEKSYESIYTVYYNGKLFNNTIAGTWVIPNQSSGPFRIEFGLQGWAYGSSYIGFADEDLSCGIYYDDYYKNWGLIYCQSTESDYYTAKIDLANGQVLQGTVRFADPAMCISIQGGQERAFMKYG